MPQGFAEAPYRSTDSTVYVCVEGQGRTVVGEQTLAWGPRDIFVVPNWTFHYHVAQLDDVVLFSFSDRPVQQKLGLWRQERGLA